MPRQQFDWEAIERDYRLGRFSNRELSRRHGASEAAIRHRAKKFGWQVDLSLHIREAVRRKIAASTGRPQERDIEPGYDPIKEAELRGAKEASDEEIVERASDVVADLLRDHQRILGRTRAQLDTMNELTDRQLETLRDQIVNKKGASDEEEGEKISMASVSRLLNVNTQTLEKLIKLERLAHGMDDVEGSGVASKTIDELLSDVAPE